MTNIYSKKITLESVDDITNWVEPLAKVYERQINQIDRQHGYLRDRDVQAEKQYYQDQLIRFAYYIYLPLNHLLKVNINQVITNTHESILHSNNSLRYNLKDFISHSTNVLFSLVNVIEFINT